MSVDGAAASSSATETSEAELRPAGEPQVPDSRPGSRRERQGAGNPAVPGGEDLQVDEGPDPRGGEPEVEAQEVDVVDIRLGGPTTYTDYPAIPQRFERSFQIHILPRGVEPSLLHHSVIPDPGDVVSDTIRDWKTWEVPETIFAMSAFAAAPRGTVFLDVGCHVGWFSLIAVSFGLDTISVDADQRMLDLLWQSYRLNGFDTKAIIRLRHELVDATWEPPDLDYAENLIVKMDIEGSEVYALRALWPLFEQHKVSHLLMEVSPVFEDYYPSILGQLFDLGYIGFVMPLKEEVPPTFDNAEAFLRNHCRRLDSKPREWMQGWVSRQHQFDMVIFRHDARFG